MRIRNLGVCAIILGKYMTPEVVEVLICYSLELATLCIYYTQEPSRRRRLTSRSDVIHRLCMLNIKQHFDTPFQIMISLVFIVQSLSFKIQLNPHNFDFNTDIKFLQTIPLHIFIWSILIILIWITILCRPTCQASYSLLKLMRVHIY